MSPEEILQLIEKYGLSVRQIPQKVISTLDIRHELPGDKVKTVTYNAGQPNEFPRTYCQRERIPKNAGWWMSKVMKDTGETVIWSADKDHLTPTIAESVQMAVKQHLEQEEAAKKNTVYHN